VKKYVNDFCPNCGKPKKVFLYNLGKRCRSCANRKRYENKHFCKYFNCSNKTTVEYCRLHKKLIVNRHKVEARWIVNNAIADGRLQKRDCIICGDSNSEAHHPDHNNPLLIEWLCKKDHLTAHGGKFN
jgi:hypothetical protein